MHPSDAPPGLPIAPPLLVALLFPEGHRQEGIMVAGRYLRRDPILHTPEGRPLYLFEEGDGRLQLVSVNEGGKPYFSDSRGRPRDLLRGRELWTGTVSAPVLGGAFLGAALGELPGLVVGAIFGLILAYVSSRKR